MLRCQYRCQMTQTTLRNELNRPGCLRAQLIAPAIVMRAPAIVAAV